MDGAVAGSIHKASGWSITLGVIMILLGIVAMFAPWEFGLLIVLVVGWSAIFNGGAQIFYAFGTHKGGGRIALEILLGLVYIVAGIYLLMHPGSGLIALTLFLASILLVYGVIALVLAFHMRPHPGWGWVLFDGLITILLGGMIWFHWPWNAPWVVGTLFGISIFVSGISRLMFSMAVRGLTSKAA